MDKTMFDQLMQRLDALGAKIGEGGSFAWGAALRQTRIDGYECLGATVLCLIGLIVVAWFIPHVFRSAGRHQNGDMVIFCTIIPGALLLSLFILFAVDAADLLFNPQWWALQSLLSALSSHR